MTNSTVPEIARLRDAAASNPADIRSAFELGNALYEDGRREEAITWWEKAGMLDRESPAIWRNLGIGYFNVFHDKAAAKGAYQRAFKLSLARGENAHEDFAVPDAAHILYERDQIWKIMRAPPDVRRMELEAYPHLVRQRDDLTVEYGALLNQMEHYDQALAIMRGRPLKPWDSTQRLILKQWTRANIGLGRRALWRSPGSGGDPEAALQFFEAALEPPENLGEKWGSGDDRSEACYWAGMALRVTGQAGKAIDRFAAAASAGTSRVNAGREYSDGAYWAGMALAELGRHEEAQALYQALLEYSGELNELPAKPGAVSTSLSAPAVFDEDTRARQIEQALLLEVLARHGLNGGEGTDRKTARRLLNDVLRDNPSQGLAADLLVALDWM